MDIKEEDILGDNVGRHWYYKAKAQYLVRYLQGMNCRRILDVGAGSGFFSKLLLEHSSAESSLCVDPGYAEIWDDSVRGKALCFFR